MNNNIIQAGKEFKKLLGNTKVFTDPLYTLAKGTDASFYRLTPKVVVCVDNESEALGVISICHKLNVPLTFKAGGTSLSGQTITDSVLMEISDSYSQYNIEANGHLATFQCGIRGGLANQRLTKFGRKLGPSPASINSARIGGIVSNNASGASYGIKYNSYNTIKGMRLVLADGSIIDTRDKLSVDEFSNSHPQLINGITDLSQKVKSTPHLADKIRHKYELKNTTGYGINALIDFSNPIDIIQHLMVGSEGTLGFISEVTFETVEDAPIKATSLIFFKNIREACDAIIPLRRCSVSAAELMDRNALRSVQEQSGMEKLLTTLDNEVVALLIDTSAWNHEQLNLQIDEIIRELSVFKTVYPISFTTDTAEYNKLWKIRKGLFTSAAAPRPTGTACIIEDLAFRADVLGDALVDLKKLIEQYNYSGYVIWGHLLDGNIHFVLMPDFNNPEGISKYARFMDDLVQLTVHRYDGSLKAEHGTGRNMAPFVKEEWGTELYDVMKQIKAILDPKNLLNPGVLINDDPELHIKNLKPLPPAHEIVDKCIECGFCEPACPSRNVTLTPRQRIVVYRELTRLQTLSQEPGRLKLLKKGFEYHGEATCATDGLCALNCPVEINTGLMVKDLRFKITSKSSIIIARWMASHMSLVTRFTRNMLGFVSAIHSILGTRIMLAITSFIRIISFKTIPAWNPNMPKAAPKLSCLKVCKKESSLKVVYFPTCINRTMGNSQAHAKDPALIQETISLLQKAGYEVLFPDNLDNLCCGMAFDSKGFKQQGYQKAKELEAELLKVSENGKHPVYCDMSPCLLRMKETLTPSLQLHDPVSFILNHLADKLNFTQLDRTITVHSTCSNTKMGLSDDLTRLAKLCVTNVVVPDEISCCGWAGDRGFTHPELTASALKPLRKQLGSSVLQGYSTSRTCEIGLSQHSGINYRSIVYLVNEATTGKATVD